MTEPTLSDCINYMKQQLKGMEKYPKSYEFNIPYYRKTIEFLETRGTTDGNCATCVKAVVIDERPHGEWICEGAMADYTNVLVFRCSVCEEHFVGHAEDKKSRHFCPNCGADMRKEGEAE